MQQRKHIRLSDYNYAAPGGYFVTICTRGRKPMFGGPPIPVGRGPCAPPPCTARDIVSCWIQRIPDKFPGWTVDKWVVMPNHVHLLLQMHPDDAAGHTGPALQDVVAWYKTMTTNACIRAVKAGEMPPFEKAVWQTSFYDEIIRGHAHYLRTWQYIHDNPARWAEDEYFISPGIHPPVPG